MTAKTLNNNPKRTDHLILHHSHLPGAETGRSPPLLGQARRVLEDVLHQKTGRHEEDSRNPLGSQLRSAPKVLSRHHLGQDDVWQQHLRVSRTHHPSQAGPHPKYCPEDLNGGHEILSSHLPSRRGWHPPLVTHRREMLCHYLHRNMSLPRLHPLTTLYNNSGVEQHAPVWLPSSRQPLLVRALQALNSLSLPLSPPQPLRPHFPISPWLDFKHMFALHIPGLPPKPDSNILAASLFLELDRYLYHHHLRLHR